MVGMSTMVVTPPDAAAEVQNSKPSHSLDASDYVFTFKSIIPGIRY